MGKSTNLQARDALGRMARAADCDGYVLKANASQDLIRGIRAVLRAEEFYSSLDPKRS